MTTNSAYWHFYLMGRNDRRLRSDLDVDKLALQASEKVKAEDWKAMGAAIRAVVTDACELAARSLEGNRARNRWLSDHEDQIKEDGLDELEAWKIWRQGRVDELAHATEDEVLEMIERMLEAGMIS